MKTRVRRGSSVLSQIEGCEAARGAKVLVFVARFGKASRMNDLDFIIDTKASEDSHTLKSAFPVFSNSKYRLESEDEDGNKSEQSQNDGDSDSDEYFGEFI